MPTPLSQDPRTAAVMLAVCEHLNLDPAEVVTLSWSYGAVTIVRYDGNGRRGRENVRLSEDEMAALEAVADRAGRTYDAQFETTVAGLSAADFGRVLTIEHDGTTITGPLRGLDVQRDWIAVPEMGEDPDKAERIPGAMTVRLRIGPWETGMLGPDTPVRLAEPKRAEQ